MTNRFNKFTENVLRGAGWFPNRNVSKLISQWKMELERYDSWKMFPEAEKVLLEFGGLKIAQNNSGFTCARETFHINPLLAVYESDRFEEFEEKLKIKFFPLGESSSGHTFLAIGEDKRVFHIMMNLWFIADNFDQALENLIVGIKAELIY